MTESRRPALSATMSGDELRRWYWLKDELLGFARSLGIPTTGGKETLTARIAARLDGLAFTEPANRRSGTAARQLTGPVTATTVIPAGQRCSQTVRAWFSEQVGASFRFDDQLRSFFASADGTRTLQDALDHYRATRPDRRRGGAKPIDAQFEYNRFTRAWRAGNVGGSADDLRRAWQDYRNRPVDERGRI